MIIDKHCILPGCRGIPCWGFGAHGSYRFACTAHRNMIWPQAEGAYSRPAAPVGEGRGRSVKAAQPSPQPQVQGVML